MTERNSRLAATLLLSLGTLLGLVGCSSDSDAPGQSKGASSGSGGASTSTGTGAASGSGGGGGTIPGAATCGDVVQAGADPVETKLPKLGELTNLRACVNGDAVNLTFDPVDPALDYRIYPLPADGDITLAQDGTVVVKDAIYRCAGTREALYLLVDDPTTNDNSAGGSTMVNGDVEGFTRAEADATLGYVFTTPGAGRLPVYVLGDGDPGSEGGYSCGRAVFHSTRPKFYTTDAKHRDELLAMHARDDGIAFYVPEAGSAGTHSIYEGTVGDGDVLRWIDGPEGTERAGDGMATFDVLDAPAEGTSPLMRVHVSPYCSKQHDELVAGAARFKKVRAEGDHPLTALRWSGLTADTVLVVEALDGGCPYQGHLSPEHADAFTDSMIDYPAYLTLDDMRAASPTGEVYVNGQYDTQTAPKAIARSFVRAAPVPPRGLDFYATFANSEKLEAFTEVPGELWVDKHFTSPTYDFTSYANSKYLFGTMLGELWFAYSDVAADVNGKVRLTPHVKGSLAADTYLHVTSEVDIISTMRRYPQILISDQVAPVQENLPSGTTLVIQPKDFTPTYMQLQICDHRTWDVNNQCPLLPTFAPDYQPTAHLPGELTGTDNAVKLDIYVSSQRVYLMLDDAPYSCTELPAKAEDGMSYSLPTGPVSVTWGDVLYHSGVDFETGGGPIQGESYLFHRTKMHVVSRRHFDNIGFTSGQPAPPWDEARFPCAKSM